jgi:MFS family permease
VTTEFESPTTTRWVAIHGVAFARALSTFGTFVTVWTLVFRERSEGPVAIAAMMIAGSLPYVLFGPWVGWLADRFSTRSIIPIVAIAQGALTLVFILDLPFLSIIGLVFVYTLIAAIEAPTWQALVPGLAKSEDLTRVYGVSIGYNSVAQVAAPVGAGILVGTTGYVWPFVIDALSFVLLAIAPFLLRVNRRGHKVTPEHRESTLVGYRHLWSDPLLRPVTVLLCAFILALGAINTGEVFLVMDVLGANETTYGLIGAVWAVGNLVGSVMLGIRAIRIDHQPRWLVFSLWTIGTGVLAISLSPSLWFVAIANGLTGVGSAYLHTTATAILMKQTPEKIRGRVNAAFAGFMNIGNIIATALAGIAIAALGVREVMIACGILSLAALLVWGGAVYRARMDETETAHA